MQGPRFDKAAKILGRQIAPEHQMRVCDFKFPQICETGLCHVKRGRALAVRARLALPEHANTVGLRTHVLVTGTTRPNCAADALGL